MDKTGDRMDEYLSPRPLGLSLLPPVPWGLDPRGLRRSINVLVACLSMHAAGLPFASRNKPHERSAVITIRTASTHE